MNQAYSDRSCPTAAIEEEFSEREPSSSIPLSRAKALIHMFRVVFQKHAITPPTTIKTTPDAIATQKSTTADEVSDEASTSLFEAEVSTRLDKDGDEIQRAKALTRHQTDRHQLHVPRRPID